MIIYSLPYVYKVTNIHTGQYYIGSRKGNVDLNFTPEADFLVEYFSSSYELSTDIENNTHNYKGEILYRFGDYEVVYWYEQLLIKQNIKNELCVNGNYQDPDTCKLMFSTVGKTHSAETKAKISKAHKGKSRETVWNKGKTGVQVAWNKGLSNDDPRVAAISARLSTYRKGKPSPWKGQTASIELKQKLSDSAKNRVKVLCPHCNKMVDKCTSKRWHFDNCKSYSL